MIIRKYDNEYIIKIYNLKDNIKENIKKAIQKLIKKYSLNGKLEADIYINESYGIIIELKELYKDEELEIDVHIHICEYFLEKINIRDIKKYNSVFYFDNEFYTYYYKDIDSNVIYKDIDYILDNSIKIK